MNFTKMQALGNDYIVVNAIETVVPNTEEFVKNACERRLGIGADGVLFVKSSEKEDFKMEIYNADGSRASMCGNGIRCLAKYVYEHGLTKKTELEIETDVGVRNVILDRKDGKIQQITVDLGAPILDAHYIPIASEKDMVLNEPIDVKGTTFYMTGVSMGNPHAVVFVKEVVDFPIEKFGAGFEYHPKFPERVNVEFVKILDRKRVAMRVWERGVGETFACGTGAGAVCVAGVLSDLTDEEVTVKLKRGNLFVRWDRNANRVILTGDAKQVFDGTYNERLK